MGRWGDHGGGGRRISLLIGIVTVAVGLAVLLPTASAHKRKHDCPPGSATKAYCTACVNQNVEIARTDTIRVCAGTTVEFPEGNDSYGKSVIDCTKIAGKMSATCEPFNDNGRGKVKVTVPTQKGIRPCEVLFDVRYQTLGGIEKKARLTVVITGLPPTCP